MSCKSSSTELANVSSNLETGGYIEHAELNIQPYSDDNTIPADCILKQWYQNVAATWEQATGKNFFITSQIQDTLTQAGFVDVTEKTFKIPLGPWSSDENYKQLGRWEQQFWRTGMEGWLVAIATRILGVSG